MDILQHTTSRNKQAKILGNLSMKEKASWFFFFLHTTSFKNKHETLFILDNNAS